MQKVPLNWTDVIEEGNLNGAVYVVCAKMDDPEEIC